MLIEPSTLVFTVHTQQITLNDDSFDAYITHLKPDYVIFDRFILVIISQQYASFSADYMHHLCRRNNLAGELGEPGRHLYV